MHGVMCGCRGYFMPKEGVYRMFMGATNLMVYWGGMFICCRIRAHVHATLI